ncbi:MAG: hypothetical protein NTX73_17025 [Rhodobacterales bacterium]|nr:hypothetical protein [Rhodobacterales bacterium]
MSALHLPAKRSGPDLNRAIRLGKPDVFEPDRSQRNAKANGSTDQQDQDSGHNVALREDIQHEKHDDQKHNDHANFMASGPAFKDQLFGCIRYVLQFGLSGQSFRPGPLGKAAAFRFLSLLPHLYQRDGRQGSRFIRTARAQ